MDRKDAIKSTIVAFAVAFAIAGFILLFGYVGIGLLWNNGHKVWGTIVYAFPVLSVTALLAYTLFRRDL